MRITFSPLTGEATPEVQPLGPPSPLGPDSPLPPAPTSPRGDPDDLPDHREGEPEPDQDAPAAS